MNFAYKMTPAFRHGAMTPWGGSKLKTLYGKDIPDEMTGESLEASTLPGLESRLPDGRTLTELCGGPLPLLLKFIDAKERLSVQVHPDDAFAAEHENGKLGKEEAWLILHAEPGARLVYGLKPDTDLTKISGREIEDCLRWVDVRDGDVLYIPSGTVHAIGAGIVLYEIQQSSDVTYRFWDWGKLGADGKPRQLHWDKACQCARPELTLQPEQGKEEAVPGGAVLKCLQTRFFALDKLRCDGSQPLRFPQRESFRYVTILSGTGALRHGDETLPARAGDTFFVPAGVEEIYLEGKCEAAVSSL